MRRIAVTAVLLLSFLAGAGAQQRTYQKFQSAGSVDVGSTTAISVTTTPAILLSTGAISAYFNAEPGYYVYAATGVAGTTAAVSDYMNSRMFLEIYNDTTNQIFLGYTASVSSIPGANYGRNIPPGTAWSHDCSLMNHFIVADAPTLRKVVVTQER